MFTNLTYKKKIILMMAGFVVFLFIAWSVSIKSTFELANQCSICEEQLEFVKDAPLKIASLQKEIDVKEQILGHSNAGVEFQEHLLKQVTEFCQQNQLILREYPQVHNYIQQEYNIETNEIIVEGPFIKLLKLLYALEQEYKLGKVVSAKFMSKKDFKTNQMKLTLTIYVQNIKKEKIMSSIVNQVKTPYGGKGCLNCDAVLNRATDKTDNVNAESLLGDSTGTRTSFAKCNSPFTKGDRGINIEKESMKQINIKYIYT